MTMLHACTKETFMMIGRKRWALRCCILHALLKAPVEESFYNIKGHLFGQPLLSLTVKTLFI